jgi:glyoxylase-like metal-dependent hydrolase (beta-lactamase superfamily II)
MRSTGWGWAADHGRDRLPGAEDTGSQLEAIGVAPSRIDYLALPHLHFDYLGT